MPAKPKSAFPNPAAVLPGEADILAKVISNLADHTAKLVYADWLEERDDPRGPLLREFINAHREEKKLPEVTAAPKPWCDLVGLTLIEKLRRSELSDKTDQILALAQPAISFEIAKVSEKEIPVGTSKFGGRPDIPDNMKWPKFREFPDWPLSFLGQFNFAELQASPVARELPATGLLSVFCQYDEISSDFLEGSWCVFHFPDTAKFDRREFDDDLPMSARPSARDVVFTESLTLPPVLSPWRRGLLQLCRSADAVDQFYGSLLNGLSNRDHLLGYPVHQYGQDVLGTKKTRHLLTISVGDWDDWIDDGAMYFTISDADLERRRFDRVLMTHQ